MGNRDFSDAIVHYNANKDFTSLQCWKDAMNVKKFFYSEVLPLLPASERFNLNLQIRKAASSITSNIAEGHGRYHFQEGIQFYRIARGSLAELKDHLISCATIGYIPGKIVKLGIEKIEKAKISLNGFINYTKKQIEKFNQRSKPQ